MSNKDAYAAGLFDGEGHIAIAYNSGYGHGKGRYPRYQLQISMSQNSKAAVEWLAENYGGNTRFVRGKRSYDRGVYERWNWCLGTQAAANFLKSIRRYSIIKKDEIDVALAFQATMMITGRAKVPDNVVEIRRGYFHKIRELRKPGRIA